MFASHRRLVFARDLVLLDGRSIGLDPRSRPNVFASIRGLAGQGITVLLVEQNARGGLAASDVGAVLEAGVVRLVDRGPNLLTNPEVARLYLGGPAGAATGQRAGGSTSG